MSIVYIISMWSSMSSKKERERGLVGLHPEPETAAIKARLVTSSESCNNQGDKSGGGEARRCGRCRLAMPMRRERTNTGGAIKAPILPRSRQNTGTSASTDSDAEGTTGGDSFGGSTSPSRVSRSSELTIDSFEQLAQLGEGGYGKVMLVRKRSNQNLYALKAMLKSQYARSDSAQSVLDESQAMQSIRHPFIMKMYGAFQDELRFYFILEFVPGGDLFEALEKHGPTFSEPWCQIYVAEIALALDAIHSLGYMYRDLKLENILVTSDGHLKRAPKLDCVLHSLGVPCCRLIRRPTHGSPVRSWRLRARAKGRRRRARWRAAIERAQHHRGHLLCDGA